MRFKYLLKNNDTSYELTHGAFKYGGSQKIPIITLRGFAGYQVPRHVVEVDKNILKEGDFAILRDENKETMYKGYVGQQILIPNSSYDIFYFSLTDD